MRTAARPGLAIYVVVMLLLFVSTLIAAEPSIAAPPASTSFRDKGAAKLSQSIRTKYPLIQAVLVLRGDLPVFEYYRKGAEPNDLLPANSVTKSVMSTLIGIALGQGSFSSLDQGLGELLPEVFEAGVDTRVREITIRHLLTMTSGFNQTASIGAVSPSGLLWAWSLHRPLLDAPGRRFNYDNEASHLLSVLLTRAIKQDPTRFAASTCLSHLGSRITTGH
jgi:CubicO group peptidase (beta-lactamase class C family)